MIKTGFNGKEIYLYLSGQAMFSLDEIKVAWNDGHVERVSGIGELLADADAERVGPLTEAAEILQRAALAARRALGQEEFDVIPAAQLLAIAKPKDLVNLRMAVLKAIVDGYATDAKNDQPVDLFMQENLKKKTSRRAGRNIPVSRRSPASPPETP